MVVKEIVNPSSIIKMELGKMYQGNDYLFILLEDGTEIKSPHLFPYVEVPSTEDLPPEIRLKGTTFVALLNFERACGTGVLFKGKARVQNGAIKKQPGTVIGVVEGEGGGLPGICRDCNAVISVWAIQECFDKNKDRP